MNRNEIIIEVFNDKKYIDYCRKVMNGHDLHKDLFQYVCEYLMKINEERLIALHTSGGLRMYVARIIYINGKIKTSQFFKQYQEPESINERKIIDIAEEETVDIEIEALKIKTIIEKEIEQSIQQNQYPASAKLFEIYVECGNAREVARRTGIPKDTVWKYINEFKNKIKSQLK